MSMESTRNQLIFKLEKTNVLYAKKLSNEINHNLKLDAKIGDLTARVKEAKGKSLKHHRKAEGPASFMSKLGTHAVTEVMAKRKAREVKMLEAELNRVTKMMDRESEGYLEKRRIINDMRKDAINQNGRFATVQKLLEQTKLEMARALAAAQKIDFENQEIAEKRRRMTREAEEDASTFYDTNAETLSFKMPTGSKRREKVQEMDVSVQGLTPGQRIRRRMKELSLEAKMIRTEDETVAQEIEKYEAAFEALRRCTGLSDLGDIVRVFTEEEERKLRQMQIVQDLIDQYNESIEERKMIETEMSEYHDSWSSFDERQQSKIQEFRDIRDGTKRDALQYDKQHAQQVVELDKIGESIHRLFYALDCESVGVEATMQELTAKRERSGSFFAPQRRNSDLHKQILSSMRSERDLLATGASDANPQSDGGESKGDADDDDAASEDTEAREKKLMEEGLMETREPEVPLHRKAFPSPKTPGYDPDDETYHARSMGTPTRRGTRQHARVDVDDLMKTGVTHDNVLRYISIVENRVLQLATEMKEMSEKEGASLNATIPRDATLGAIPPPMENFEAPTEFVDPKVLVSTLDKTIAKFAASPTRTQSVAWRGHTPAVSPIGRSRPKAATEATILPKVATRSDLESEIMRDFSDQDLTNFIRKMRSDSKPSVGRKGRSAVYATSSSKPSGRPDSGGQGSGVLASAGSMSMSM